MGQNVIISTESKIGKNVVIEDNVKVLGASVVGDDSILRSGSRLENVILGKSCEVTSSQVVSSTFGDGCIIGPYANVRANCKVANNVKVGAFVEIKNATIGTGTKIAHLSYVGDATLGENINVGCGVVFANYDGVNKHMSIVGNNVFIGCNVNLVAPVSIADNTYICAGTTVTKDTEPGDFVIGRVRQENKKRKNK